MKLLATLALLAGLTPAAAAQVTSYSPTSVPAVTLDGLPTIVVQGANFAPDLQVSVAGKLLENPVIGPQHVIVTPTEVRFLVPHQDTLGLVPVTLSSASAGTSETIDLRIVANQTPLMDLHADTPSYLLSGVPAGVTVAGLPGDFGVLYYSPDLSPTPLQGIVEGGLAIGSGGSSLIRLRMYTIPPKGHITWTFDISAFPAGSSFHLQAAHLLQGKGHHLPATPSNVQTGTILF